MDPGPILYTEIQSTAILFYCFLQTIIIHTIHLILCYSKPVRLTTSLFRWGKVLWLCCAGSTLAPESLVLRRTTSRRHQPSTCFLAPTGSINLGFILRENLPLYASHLPLGVPNGRVLYAYHCFNAFTLKILLYELTLMQGLFMLVLKVLFMKSLCYMVQLFDNCLYHCFESLHSSHMLYNSMIKIM